jgi:hypothetical protein
MLQLTLELLGIELDEDFVNFGHFPAAATANVVLAICSSSCRASYPIIFGHQGVACRRGFEQGFKGLDLTVGAA